MVLLNSSQATSSGVSKIKLVVVISDFRIGGAQKVVADILNFLDQDKYSIHLIVLFQFSNQETFFEIIPSGVEVHNLSFEGFSDISSWLALYTILRKINPDIVWSHLFFSNTIIRFLKPLFRFKVITVEHNTYLSRTRMEKFVDRLLSFLTFKVVAVSRFVAEHIVTQEKISPKRITVIYNGVDTVRLVEQADSTNHDKVLRDLGLTPDCKLILNIGQFITQKNQALLITAFADVVKEYPEYRLVILGDGTLRSQLEGLIIDLDITAKVIMPGVKRNVADFLVSSECLVISSKFEGFPIVSVEALACGLPIVSTPVSGSEIYVSDGVNGFLAQPTRESLAGKIKAFICLSETEKKSFKDASLIIADKLDIREVAAQYVRLFDEALRRIS